MNFLTEKRLLVLGKSLVFLILLLPLLVWRNAYFPFIVPRHLLFYFLIDLLLVIYVYLLILHPAKYKFRFNWLNWLVIGFFLVYLISSIAGVDPIASFWGIFERMDGLINQAHWLIFFLIVVSLRFSWEEWQKFFAFQAWTSIIFIFYAIGQYFGWSGFLAPSDNRVTTILGNPAYGAFYSFWLLALTIYYLNQAKVIWRRVVFSLLAIGNLWVFMATGTRGAFIGLATAVIVGLILYVIKGRVSLAVKKWLLIGLVVIVVIGGLLYTQRQSAWLNEYPIIQRLVDISPQTQTAQTRLWAWQIAWQGFLARPAFGWGPETFLSPFGKYFNPKFFQGPTSEIWFDHAHNNFLDLLVSIGVFGFLLYLGLIVWVIRMIWRWLMIDDRRLLAIIFGAWFIGHLVESFFLFDHFASYLVWFLLLAFLGSVGFTQQQSIALGKDKRQVSQRKVFMLEGLLVIGAGAILCYQFVIIPWQANQRLLKALQYYDAGYFKEGSYWYEQAKNKGFNRLGESEIIKKVAAVVVDYKVTKGLELQNSQIDDFKQAMAVLLPDFEALVSRHSADPQNHWLLARVYNTVYELTRDESYLHKAQKVIERGLELFPLRVDFWYEIAQNQIYQKKYLEAEQSFKKALELNPALVDAYWYLGVTQMGQDRYSEAELYFNQAISKGYSYADPNKLRVLLNLYLKTKNWSKIINYQEEIFCLVSQNKGNEDVYLLLALAYKRVGDEVGCKEILKKLANFNMTYQDINVVWNQLSE